MTFKRSAAFLLLGLGALTTTVDAEMYKVNVSRLEQDLYKDHSSGTLIETQYCYEYATRQDAVLKYEPYAYDNKLIFDSGTSCGVKRLR